MLKRFEATIVLVFVAATAWCAPPDGPPPERHPDGPPSDRGRGKTDVDLTLGVSFVDSSGEAGFVIGFADLPISELTYPLDGTLAEVSGAITFQDERVPWGLRLSGNYIASVDVEGTSTDKDFDPRGGTLHFSTTDCEADVAIWTVDGTLLCRPYMKDKSEVLSSMALGFTVGYGRTSFAFEDSNLEGSYNYGAEFIAVDGPVATYDIDFEGVRIGADASIAPAPRFRIGAGLTYMPALEAESEAYWILRDYPFWQSAEGEGVVLSVNASWQITPAVALHASYRNAELTADENGLEKGIQDGAYYFDEPIVDEMTAEYELIEVGLAVLF